MSTQGRTPKDFCKKSLQGAKITKKTLIGEALEMRSDAADIFFKAGLHCVGCPMSSMESIEDGCRAHGLSDKEIDKLVKELG